MIKKNEAKIGKPDRIKIGRRIMTMRMAAGLTRAQLAEQIEKSNQTMASIEYGSKGMSLSTLCAICDALSVTPNYILGWSKYSLDEGEDYSQACEEISELLRSCNPKQMKTVSSMVRLYVDDIKGE